MNVDSEKYVTLQMPSCAACRTCEMACGYHHTGEFRPNVASIQIVERENEPGYCVNLAAISTAKRKGCDLCEALDIPLCVEYCREYDDLYQVLENFRKVREELKAGAQES